jgi:hypothetical protein
MQNRIVEHEAWPARAAMLAALGAVLGLLFNLLMQEAEYRWTDDPLRLSGASLVAVGGIAFAFTVERVRWLWSALFALACGIVVALVFFWNGSPSGWTAGDEWRLFSALLAVAVAAPLFQSVRDAGEWRLGTREIHAHAWTNIVLWGAAWAFVLVSWLLAQLLGELFHLIGIDLLRDALRKSWVNLALVGGALGAATGLLRDRDKVLGSLQRVATTVLSVLAPVLAVGLALFVLALPFTGLDPLWDKTSSTTPILLVAIAGAFLLANAIIGNAPEEEAKARALRLSAMVLGAVMTPLAIVAAISTWLRIDQHGFTPERLWALVFVLIVLAVSASYLWVAVRGRQVWADRVRPTNVRLALVVCGLALLLATPLINFGAISTRDQVARLESGKVKPEEFDWAALRFDFGPQGTAALERLSRQGAAQVRAYASKALGAKERWALAEETNVNRRASVLRRSIRILPRPAALPAGLNDALARGSICASGDCTLFWEEGSAEALAVGFGCPECQVTVTRLRLQPDLQWQSGEPSSSPGRDSTERLSDERAKAQRQALSAGRVEVREVRRRQVFLNGEPVAAPF